MKPLVILDKPLAKCIKNLAPGRLSSMRQTESRQQGRVGVRVICVSLSLASIVGCQTLPQSALSSSDDTTTAHGLMKQTMLHRFDQSYDYQKTTHYQVASLYEATDIEARDHSLFFTLLQVVTGDNQYPKTRAVTGPQLACEDTYTMQYQAIMTESQVSASDASSMASTNRKIGEAKAAYDGCLQRGDTDIDTDIGNGTTPVTPYTTIASMTAQQPVDNSYQTTVKKLITFFDMLDRNMQAPVDLSDKAATANQPKVDSPPQTPNNRAPKKYLDIDKQVDKVVAHGEPDIPVLDDLPTNKSSSNVVSVLRNLRLTPEQIQVLNDAYLTPKTIRYQGNYNHEKGQFSSVLEESSDTAYQQSYKRIPMLVDFNEMSITFEPDAALPFAGLFFDKALPESLAGKSLKFVLPDTLRQNIPLPLLKSTLVYAIGQAYGDIDPEKYTELKPDKDAYAMAIKAQRVIKVHMTPQDLGFVVGRTLKHWSGALAKLRAEHPEYIKDAGNFAATLDLMAAANRLYRAEDLAKISQLLEAVLPISYNSYNYYYFDRGNQLIGYRKIRDYQSGLLKARGKAITTSQINYHRTQTERPYYQPKPETVIDGNALLKQLNKEQRLKREAEDARFGYLPDSNTGTSEMPSNHAAVGEGERLPPQRIEK